MTTAEQFDALLEAERSALLAGDLEKVAKLMAEKEQLVKVLEDCEEASDGLADLRSKVRRNHTLFDSALAGIRTVVNRLGRVQAVSKQLDTYDSSGQRQAIGTRVSQSLEKRA